MNTAPPPMTVALGDAPDWTLLPGETGAAERIRAEAALFNLSRPVSSSAVIARCIGNAEDGPQVRGDRATQAARQRDSQSKRLRKRGARTAMAGRMLVIVAIGAMLATCYWLTR